MLMEMFHTLFRQLQSEPMVLSALILENDTSHRRVCIVAVAASREAWQTEALRLCCRVRQSFSGISGVALWSCHPSVMGHMRMGYHWGLAAPSGKDHS